MLYDMYQRKTSHDFSTYSFLDAANNYTVRNLSINRYAFIVIKSINIVKIIFIQTYSTSLLMGMKQKNILN